MDITLSGPRHTVDFAPAARLAYLFSSTWAAGLEHYTDFGPIDDFDRPSRRFHWTVKFILGWGW